MPLPGERSDEPGAPFPMGPAPRVTEVGTFGDIESGDGAKVIIQSGNVLFLAYYGGAELLIGVTIEHMLDMLAEYNSKEGN